MGMTIEAYQDDSKVNEIIASVCGDISKAVTREKIELLEHEFKKLDQVDIPVTHRYAGGVYAREITIPAGTFLIGKIYKDDHFDVMIDGDVSVTSAEGTKRLIGFNLLEGKRGKKRAGYAHKDTRWVTFHSSPKLNDDDYLKYLTSDSFAEFEREVSSFDLVNEFEIIGRFKESGSGDYISFKNGYLLATGKTSSLDYAKADFHEFLHENELTYDQVYNQSCNMDDLIDFDKDYGVILAPSIIHGSGLYSIKRFKCGDFIAPGRVNGMRTPAGRYTNHSPIPNAKFKWRGDDIMLVALADIHGDEITVDYRDVLSLRGDK